MKKIGNISMLTGWMSRTTRMTLISPLAGGFRCARENAAGVAIATVISTLTPTTITLFQAYLEKMSQASTKLDSVGFRGGPNVSIANSKLVFSDPRIMKRSG